MQYVVSAFKMLCLLTPEKDSRVHSRCVFGKNTAKVSCYVRKEYCREALRVWSDLVLVQVLRLLLLRAGGPEKVYILRMSATDGICFKVYP